MGTETRYHYGTGSRTTGTYGTATVPNQNAFFGSGFRFLKYPLFFTAPSWTKLNIADAHTALPGLTPNVSKHFTQTATARTTQNAES